MRRTVWTGLVMASLVACGGSGQVPPQTSAEPAAAEPAPAEAKVADAEAEPAEAELAPAPPEAEPAPAPPEAAHAAPKPPPMPPGPTSPSLGGAPVILEAPATRATKPPAPTPPPSTSARKVVAHAGALAKIGAMPVPGARVTVKQSKGALSSSETLDVVNLAQSAIEECRRQGTSFGAKRSQINVRFRVLPSGVPSQVRASGGDPSVRACLAKLTRKIQFPERKNATLVSLGFAVEQGSTGLFNGLPAGSIGISAPPSPGISAGIGSVGRLPPGQYPLARVATSGPKGTVRAGASSVNGGLKREVIQRVIGKHLPRIRYCYESQLQLDPRLSGRVTTTFSISPQGVVTAATATGINAKVSECVQRALKTMRFPKPAGGKQVVVSYPFSFIPA